MITMSAMTTTPREVSLTGPCAPVSARMAMVTAGESEASTTPRVSAAVQRCAGDMPARKGMLSESRPAARVIPTSAAARATSEISTTLRRRGRRDFRSSSQPAVSAMRLTATPFTMRRSEMLCGRRSPSASGPVARPQSR